MSALGAEGSDIINGKPKRVGLIGSGWYGKSDVFRLMLHGNTLRRGLARSDGALQRLLHPVAPKRFAVTVRAYWANERHIRNLDNMAAHGINLIGAYIQGSNAGWPDADAGANGFTRDGKLRSEAGFLSLSRAIRAAVYEVEDPKPGFFNGQPQARKLGNWRLVCPHRGWFCGIGLVDSGE